MAVPGPSTRIYSIDNAAGSPTVWTPLIVGEPSGIGGIEQALHELTGPASINPVFLPPGFTKIDDMTFVFQADIGGSSPADPTTEFWVTQTGSRTILVTFVTNWTFGCEAYITKSLPKGGVALLSLLEVTFKATGAATTT